MGEAFVVDEVDNRCHTMYDMNGLLMLCYAGVPESAASSGPRQRRCEHAI
jgi:hypothetical protein